MPIMAGAEPFHFSGAAEDAVLLVHGFTGTPWEMRPLGEALAQRDVASRGVLLRGHGTHPQDMLSCCYDDWVLDAEAAFDDLAATHRQVYLVGLSMGGTIALNLAARRAADPRVAGVVTINSPLRLTDWRLGLGPVVSHLLRWQAWGRPDIKDTRAWASHVGYRRFRPEAVQQLLGLLGQTRAALPRVHQPLLVLQATQDHIVPRVNAELILRGVGSHDKRLVWLHNSYHVATVDFDAPTVCAEVTRFVDDGRGRSEAAATSGPPLLAPAGGVGVG